MSAAPRAATRIADFEQARFDRALIDLQLADPSARVALCNETGLALGIDAVVNIKMPHAAQALTESDRAAAASVLFLDQLGSLFGISGWHVLEPRFATPIGSTIWFTFSAQTTQGEKMINVCVKDNSVIHVRVGAQ